MGVLAGLSTPNPWRKLNFGRPPYLFPEDEGAVLEHNRRHPKGTAYHVHLEAYPEPFIGDPDAPILLLNRNPGYTFHPLARPAHPALEALYRDNLLHASAPFPFYPLSPTYAQHHASTWWRQSLRHWIAKHGEARVSKAFFCAESMPYHSPKYRALSGLLPSQQYTRDLVAAKIRMGALVIVMRGWSDWTRALGLPSANWHVVKNHQTKSLSPPGASREGNLTPLAARAVESVLASIA